MAASLNYEDEGFKLNVGNKLLVSVEIFSENVIIVTGFVGSRKYKGALLGTQCEYARPCNQENVFNWDFSLKNNLSHQNLYYKNRHLSDTSILPSKMLLGSSYICANCKMKMSKCNKKMPIKSLISETRNNVIHKSDIILLKQTLSYPELSLDKTIITPISNENEGQIKISPTNVITKKLKRKKTSNCNQSSAKKRKRLVSPKEEHLSHMPIKDEKCVDVPINEGITLRSCRQLNDINCKPVTYSEAVNPNETIDCHENVRVMPQTLSRLNNISSTESYQEIEDFLNRECPKPKKIWMKMIENEDSLKTDESNVQSSSIESLDISECLEAFIEVPNIEPLVKDSSPELTNIEDVIQIVNEELFLESDNKECLERDLKLSHLDSVGEKCFPIDEKSPPDPVLSFLTSETSNIEDSLAPATSDLPLNTLNDNISLEFNIKDEFQDFNFKESEPDPVNNDSKVDSSLDLSPSKQMNSSKFSHFNRSYKIKQTLHDKVILTVERGSLNPAPQNVPLINDIYSFTDEDDNVEETVVPNVCMHEPNKLSVPFIEGETVTINCVNEYNTRESTKSLRSNNIKKPKATAKMIPNKIDKPTFERKLQLDNKTEHVDSAPLLSYCENSAGTMFKLDDVVWAKITGYPFWPARIISFNIEDELFIACIEWYAWKEVSFIKVNNLFHFKEFYQSKYQRKKRNSKYQEAVKLARGCSGMLDGLDNPVSDDLVTLCSTKDSDSESESNEGSGTSAS